MIVFFKLRTLCTEAGRLQNQFQHKPLWVSLTDIWVSPVRHQSSRVEPSFVASSANVHISCLALETMRVSLTMTTMHLFLSSSTSITSPGNPSICRHGTSAGVHPTHAICCYQINIHSYTILHSYIYIDAHRATPHFHSPIQSP